MAYDRAPRRGLPVLGATGPNISPNTYYVCDDICCCCKGTNWAPFLTCSCRTTKHSAAGPSPNAYFPKVSKRIIGAASMLYTEPRFSDNNDFNLVLYDPYHDNQEPKEKPVQKLKGYMYHCYVPYTLYGYMPSIPDKGHLGYMICDDGKTVAKCCYSDCDKTPGSDLLFPTFGTFCSCYRGCFWSRRTSKRFNPVKFDIPPVGTYNIKGEKDPAEEYFNMVRHEKKKNAKLPRYIEQIQCAALRNNYPAPNSYNIGNANKCLKTNKVPVPKKPICRKIRATQFQSPAPNAYTDPRTALEYLVKPSCVKHLNAFLVNAPRFRERKTQDGPAPNQYHIKSFVEEIGKKISPYAVRKTAFDTSVPKKLFYLKPMGPIFIKPKRCKCSEIQPPGEKAPEPSHPTYPFSSKEDRFKPPKQFYQASCASYNITPAFNHVYNHKSFRKVAKNNFHSSEKRFYKLTNFAVVEDKSYIPGPTYDLRNYRPGRKNNFGSFDRQLRFRDISATAPGPLSYHLHPSIMNSILKRSFNITLGKNYVLSTYQQYRRKLRPQKWVRRRDKISVFRRILIQQRKEKPCLIQPIKLNLDMSKIKTKSSNPKRSKMKLLRFATNPANPRNT